MENLQKAIVDIINDDGIEVNTESAKLEQKTRNRYKTLITEALLADINDMLENTELPEGTKPVLLARIDKGIGIAIWTKYGYIPMFMEASMKGLDFDIEGAAEDYQAKLAERAEKKAVSLEHKRAKMERDAALREQKRAARAAKEAAKLAEGDEE